MDFPLESSGWASGWITSKISPQKGHRRARINARTSAMTAPTTPRNTIPRNREAVIRIPTESGSGIFVIPLASSEFQFPLLDLAAQHATPLLPSLRANDRSDRRIANTVFDDNRPLEV